MSRGGSSHAGDGLQRPRHRVAAAPLGQLVVDRDDSRPRLREHDVVVATQPIVRQRDANRRQPAGIGTVSDDAPGGTLSSRASTSVSPACTLRRRLVAAPALLASVSDTMPRSSSGALVRCAAVMPTFSTGSPSATQTPPSKCASPRGAGGHVAHHHERAGASRKFARQAQSERHRMMRRRGHPGVERGPGFDDVRGGTRENGRTIAAADERDARAGTEPIEFGENAAHRAIARAVAGRAGRGHRRRVVEQHDEMLADAGGRDPRTGEDEREGERGKALEDQAAGDRQLRDSAAAFRRLPQRPPEKQTGDRPHGKPPAEQMNGDDRGNGEQGQEPERRREDHAASTTPAAASARAMSRSGVPATRCANGAPTRRAARDSPRRRRANRAR